MDRPPEREERRRPVAAEHRTDAVAPPAYPPLADRELLLGGAGAADRGGMGVVRPAPGGGAGTGRRPGGAAGRAAARAGRGPARRPGRRGQRPGREHLAVAAALPGLRGLHRARGRGPGRGPGRHLRREPGRHRPRRRLRGGPGAALGGRADRVPRVRGSLHQRGHDVEPDRAAHGPRGRDAGLADHRLRRHQRRRLLLGRGAPLGGACGRGGRPRRTGRAQAGHRRRPARAARRRGRGDRGRPRAPA